MKRFDARFFGVAVNLKREMETLSLRDLAEKTGISASTLSRIENGEKPDIDTAITLIEWLNLSMDRFITEANDGKR